MKASPPGFVDPIVQSSPEIRNLTLADLEKDVDRLRLITGREYGHAERMRRPVAHVTVTAGQMQQALTSRLNNTYEPPGTLRDGGTPRHDNDLPTYAISGLHRLMTNSYVHCHLTFLSSFRRPLTIYL